MLDHRSSEAEKALLGFGGRPLHPNFLITQNTVIQRSADFHMICFALGPPGPVADALCSPAAKSGDFEPYDACVRIDNVVGFLHAMMQTAVILDSAGEAIEPLGRYWNRIETGAVSYGSVEIPTHETAPLQDGFLKDAAFSHQQEYRLKLHRNPRREPLFEGQSFTIWVPDLACFLREVDVGEILEANERSNTLYSRRP